MRYASRTVRRAVLIMGESRIPVIVDTHDVINVRDRRTHYEGRLWSTEMPILPSLKPFEEPFSLEFPGGEIRVIRMFSRYPTQYNPPNNPDLWDFYEASFISENNMGKD